jgi:hypothetical protein
MNFNNIQNTYYTKQGFVGVSFEDQDLDPTAKLFI